MQRSRIEAAAWADFSKQVLRDVLLQYHSCVAVDCYCHFSQYEASPAYVETWFLAVPTDIISLIVDWVILVNESLPGSRVSLIFRREDNWANRVRFARRVRDTHRAPHRQVHVPQLLAALHQLCSTTWNVFQNNCLNAFINDFFNQCLKKLLRKSSPDFSTVRL